ncbi:MAG: type II secretion system protein [Planctomycetota bacterium]
MNFNTNKERTAGFTLVELLVVITILAILVALTIPQLRVINRDRGVRESARVVGAAFASASQRAITEGSAGVMLVRNINMTNDYDRDGNPDNYNTAIQRLVNRPVFNSCTSIFQMRAIPDYTGLADGDLAVTAIDQSDPDPANWAAVPYTIQINAPPPNITINRGDRITLGDRNVTYRILTVTDGQFGTDPAFRWLLLETAGNVEGPSLPDPDMAGGKPFRISLRPRVVESSRVDLPNGYMIDLRYSGIVREKSGEIDPDNAPNLGTAGQIIRDVTGTKVGEQPISITFDSTGAINEVYGLAVTTRSIDRALFRPPATDPLGGFAMLVSEDALTSTDALSSDNSLWVTVNEGGAVSVASNVAQISPAPSAVSKEIRNRFDAARGIADTRQAASQ